MTSHLVSPHFKPFSLPSAWIWSSEASHTRRNGSYHNSAFEVRLFRKSFTLSEMPGLFVAAISADSRYEFTFNEHFVGRGPAKGDVRHQFYDTYDLTPWLRIGENVLAVRVVDYSPVRCYPPALGAPASIMSYRGGFVFDSRFDGVPSLRVVSDESWKVRVDESVEFSPEEGTFGGFVGYFERWHVRDAELGWREMGYDDQAWEPATVLYPAERLEDRRDAAAPYGLLPRLIKPCREGEARFFADVFLPGGGECPQALRDWAAGKADLVCHKGETVTCILDAARLETGFPCAKGRGGAGAAVRLTYAEALRLPAKIDSPFSLRAEGDLESVSTGSVNEELVWSFDRRGTLNGFSDSILLDERSFVFEPTHWRTFRYVKVEITAADAEVRLAPVTFRFWAYPMDLKTEVQTEREADRKIWDISARTLQLCSHETFEDCPYYEQLQYAGDSLITSRLTHYLTRDSSLVRQALSHFAWSITPEGITASRYPCTLPQVIPSWSLHWISLSYDYVLFTGDREFVKGLLPAIDSVLAWFRRYADADGLPAKLPYWNCVDWTPGWQRGQPPGWDTGVTGVIACQYVQALRETAALKKWCGVKGTADLRGEAQKCGEAIERRFWDEKGGYYRDAETKPDASMLANAWAVCAGIVPKEKEALVARHLALWSPANASYFGMFWIFRALRMLGKNEWWLHLAPWEKLIDTGLTTWPEDTAFWRSMCHAWSAHPIAEYIEGLLGLRVEAPGWDEVTLSPVLGPLRDFKFRLCTPHGEIAGTISKTEAGLGFDISKPAGIRLRVVCGDSSTVEDGPRLLVDLPRKAEAVMLS